MYHVSKQIASIWQKCIEHVPLTEEIMN